MKVQFLDELIRFRPPFKILERIRMLYGDSIIDQVIQSYFFSTNQSKPNQDFSPFPHHFPFLYVIFQHYHFHYKPDPEFANSYLQIIISADSLSLAKPQHGERSFPVLRCTNNWGHGHGRLELS